MTDNPISPKITADQALADLLRLGQKLHQYAYPRGDLGLTRSIRPIEAERLKAEIAELQKRVEVASADKNHRYLRSCLEVLRDQVPDPVLLRVVAYLSWHCLSCEPISPSTAKLTNAAGMGEIEGVLNARRVVRRLVGKGDVLVFKGDGYPGGEILPGVKINRLLTGDSGLSAIWTEETLKAERDQAERSNDDTPKPVASAPRQTAPAVLTQTPTASPNLLTARGIFDSLKDQVIAMEQSLMRFSAQMSLHMRRLEQIRKGIRPTVGPIVTLLIGSSGSGKTWMSECFARTCGLPYAVADMSSVSQSCYVGLSIDECFYGLLANKTKPADAQKGILVWDEFDKLCAKGGGGHNMADPQGRSCQAECLKPLEGTKIPLGSRRSNTPYLGTLDTYETCFILAGAFDGLREMLIEGGRRSMGLGFGSGAPTGPRGDIREALVNYGFLGQIINRVGAIIVLPDPIPDQIVRIATHPSGLIAKQNAFLGSFGLKLVLTEAAIRHAACWACDTKGYSRAVKTLLGTLTESHLYDDKAGDIQVGVEDVRRAISETESSERLKA
jgi:ATP-dependent Clp protease ATP-binding subunit ClpX